MSKVRFCGTVLLACLGADSLPGQSRHFRLFDGGDGLVPTVVTALAQGRDGLLWVGTSGGLFRYDGTRFERWAPERLDTWIATITVSRDGEVIVIDEKEGAVLRVVPSGAEDVIGPSGPIRGAKLAVFDWSGGLWLNIGRNLMRRDTTDRWQQVTIDSIDGTQPRILVATGDEEILVPTRKAVWRVDARHPPRHLANIPNVVNGLTLKDGRIFGITFPGELVEFGDRVIVRGPVASGRGIALAERNGTIWASFDRSLVAIGPDSIIEKLAAAEGISGGGPLLRDHEGSLWMGSWQGLFQFPEPDTRVWREGQGLVSDHVRSLARFGDTLLVDTWQGSVTLSRDSLGATVARQLSTGTGFVHQVDRAGAAWIGSASGILRRKNGRVSLAWPRVAYLRRAVQTTLGTLYLATSHGLLAADRSDGRLTRVSGLPFASDSTMLDYAMVDRAGRLWIAADGLVCTQERVHAVLQRSTRSPQWWCIRSPTEVASLVEAPSGAVWAVMYRMGIWRLTSSGWEVIPGGRNLLAGAVANLVPSPAGGFWVLGSGNVLRVIEDTSLAEGWRAAERLTEWHGVPQSSVSEIVEDVDGTLWIGTMLGVVRVPASVRRATPLPPRVLLAEGSVDDQRVGFDGDLRLPYDRNRLRLRFTAVSYRDPRMLRFQVRAQPNDSWETVAGTPEFRWVDLKAGRYRAEVRASLNGVDWSNEPAAFVFRVLPPWYRSIWALLLFGSVITALIVYVHRSRVAVHVELERQRMRIAMDLHDELGSGLGSIGILAGVLRSAPHAPEQSPADHVAGEIGSTAASLGAALSDIVWALDKRSGGLDAIAARLAEHGNRLCANGVSFCTSFPDAWPATHLDLAARRNALLIGVEALHNAARHARPSRIDLSIIVEPGSWILEIADDGCGMPSDASIRGGVGLGSMRRRAEEIGADILWLPRPSGGTLVRLSVKTNGRPTGPLALRRLVRRRKASLA